MKNIEQETMLPGLAIRPATREDFNLIFEIKKEALYQYVDKIWGWNDEQQIEFLKKDFDSTRFSICGETEHHFEMSTRF